jgi:hypothetical protein
VTQLQLASQPYRKARTSTKAPRVAVRKTIKQLRVRHVIQLDPHYIPDTTLCCYRVPERRKGFVVFFRLAVILFLSALGSVHWLCNVYVISYTRLTLQFTVVIFYKSAGNAPKLKTKKFKFPITTKFQNIIEFLRKQLKYSPMDPLVRTRVFWLLLCSCM